MATDHTTLDHMFSDYAVIESAGTGGLSGITQPEVHQPYFEEGPDDRSHALENGWELLTGFTGQQSYHGPAMHPSEYVGGGLARYILSTPGLYTVFYGDGAWYVAHQPG